MGRLILILLGAGYFPSLPARNEWGESRREGFRSKPPPLPAPLLRFAEEREKQRLSWTCSCSLINAHALPNLLRFAFILELDEHVNTFPPDGVEQRQHFVRLNIDDLHGFPGGEDAAI